MTVTPDEYATFLHVLKEIPDVVKRYNEVTRDVISSEYLSASEYVEVSATDEKTIVLLDTCYGDNDHARMRAELLWLDDDGWERIKDELSRKARSIQAATLERMRAQELRQLRLLTEKYPDALVKES